MTIILFSIFLFLLFLLFLTLILDFGIFNSILSICLLIIIIIYILTILRIAIRISIKKEKYISPFKKNTTYSYIEILGNELKKIDTYQKILILDYEIIIVNKAGIFEIVYIDEKGKIKGDLNGKWYLNNKEISNPFKLKGNNVFYYIIPNGKIFYEVNVKLLPRAKAYITLEHHLNKSVFTNEEIEQQYLNILNLNNIKIEEKIDIKF